MSSRNTRFATLYDDQAAAAYQLARPRENLLDQVQNFSVVITGALLLLTLLSNYYSPDGSLRGALLAIRSFAWDATVFAIPTPLVSALDRWVNPPPGRPMRDPQQSSHAAKSETLRRVMGLDRPGGMMSSIFRARTRALSVTGSVLGLKLDYERPPGLGNRDNSCYQNCILQGLAALSSMPDYLSTCISGVDLDSDEADKNVARTLRTLLSDLNDTSNNGRTLWTPGLLKSMSTWTQQDAQEYYSLILDDIDKGAALAVKAMASGQAVGLEGNASPAGSDESAASEHSDDSGYQSAASSAKLSDAMTVRNPLEGLLAQRVACVQCGHSDGLSMVPFNCLTLSLGLDKHQHDLYERLDSYSRVETIEGVECPKCTLLKAQRLLNKLVERLRQDAATPPERLEEPLRRLRAVEAALEDDALDDATLKDVCKIPNRVSTTKTKQMVIARPPQSLVIHVNRSVFDPSTFHMIKNSAPVNFPLVLDLGPWCLGSAETTKRVDSAAPDSAPDSAATAADDHDNNNDDDDINNNDEDDGEQWELDPMASMVAGDLGLSKLTGPIYELRAAVTHYGRHENGHYICYRKYPATPPETKSEPCLEPVDDDIDADETDGERGGAETSTEKSADERDLDWWRLSDHNVSRVDEELVMSLSPGVFMLFYECVDPSMILQSTDTESTDSPEDVQQGILEAASTASPLVVS